MKSPTHAASEGEIGADKVIGVTADFGRTGHTNVHIDIFHNMCECEKLGIDCDGFSKALTGHIRFLRGIERPDDGDVARGEVGPEEVGPEEFDTNNAGGKERSKIMKNDGMGWRFEEVGGLVEVWIHRRSLGNGEDCKGIGGSCDIADHSNTFIESLIDMRK